MSDIIDVIAEISYAFRAANLAPPEAIHLRSHEDGMRFLASVAQEQLAVMVGDARLGSPKEMPDSSVWMECKVMDVAVRWPAVKYALPSGGWCYT